MQSCLNSDSCSFQYARHDASLNECSKVVAAEQAALAGGFPSHPAAAVKQSHSQVLGDREVGAIAAVNHGL